jgi:hypothetical protein
MIPEIMTAIVIPTMKRTEITDPNQRNQRTSVTVMGRRRGMDTARFNQMKLSGQWTELGGLRIKKVLIVLSERKRLGVAKSDPEEVTQSRLLTVHAAFQAGRVTADESRKLALAFCSEKESAWPKARRTTSWSNRGDW